jgi:hypothetical protein
MDSYDSLNLKEIVDLYRFCLVNATNRPIPPPEVQPVRDDEPEIGGTSPSPLRQKIVGMNL